MKELIFFCVLIDTGQLQNCPRHIRGKEGNLFSTLPGNWYFSKNSYIKFNLVKKR